MLNKSGQDKRYVALSSQLFQLKGFEMKTCFGLLVGVVVMAASPVVAVSIERVTVGNPGNAADSSTGYGAVNYVYQIGKYEVTAGQYTEFLNAVAVEEDTYGLYHSPGMSSGEYPCGIIRTGQPGYYTYSVASDWANRPVNWVSWGDAARFANWLSNGQPRGRQNLGTTEDGSYYLNGANDDSALLAVQRKTTATWVIPSENEWYKAAYHKNDGTTKNYWNYPTRSNIQPSNTLINPDPGNNGTFAEDNGANTIGAPYYRTEKGAHKNSFSAYGTFDQAGNLWEWNEAVMNDYRGRLGSSFSDPARYSRASERFGSYPGSYNGPVIGFRVALVPEPATILLLVLGGLIVGKRKK